ncbi:MAG: class I SAM-dependent methyltransferase [Luteolibacter sp.]|jgi:ubiquinone/menaquinone biosynthesis C-methylase UbiE|nr:class I SAM-dependent methyltransferase [Luteolibacter sp.]
MPPPRRPFQPPQGRNPPASRPNKNPASDRGWDPVAAWYDKLVGESGSDYHRNVIVPAALRMLAPQTGESIIDFCCGQGVLVRPLLDAGIGRFTGIDASPRLIDAAKARHGGEPRVSLVIADVCQPGNWADASHDSAVCLMAVHDVPDVKAMFTNLSRALKPGGRAVLIFMHPCFRIPRQTHWGWDADQKIQYRRIDSYGTPLEIPITTHPGKGSGEQTVFFHRPLAELLCAIGAGGLAVTSCEELYSHRRSQGSGPFSKAEHRAAEEIPVFIALKAQRL